jgi:hypothetical protein
LWAIEKFESRMICPSYRQGNGTLWGIRTAAEQVWVIGIYRDDSPIWVLPQRFPESPKYINTNIILLVYNLVREKSTRAWEPSEHPFITIVITFENAGGKTRYTARGLHWTVADREHHEQMGFHEGWGQCADQSVDLLKRM